MTIQINIKDYIISKEQIINFSLEYYAKQIETKLSDDVEFEFESAKYGEEFQKILNSTYKIRKN